MPIFKVTGYIPTEQTLWAKNFVEAEAEARKVNGMVVEGIGDVDTGESILVSDHCRDCGKAIFVGEPFYLIDHEGDDEAVCVDCADVPDNDEVHDG